MCEGIQTFPLPPPAQVKKPEINKRIAILDNNNNSCNSHCWVVHIKTDASNESVPRVLAGQLNEVVR